jgi:predicted transcriptional regulator
MQPEVQTAELNEPLQKVLERLQSCRCPLLAVTDAGKLVGIVNLDNIMELIKIQSAIQEQHSQNKWEA